MTLKVIGAGFGRTGTMSLKLALEQIGFGPCYHMVEVFKHQAWDLWYEASKDPAHADWETIFKGYNSTVDWPNATYWKELADAYPDAKIILTERDPDQWFDSTQATIFANDLGAGTEGGFPRMAAAVVGALFDQKLHDRELCTRVFREHNARVRATIPPERLLVYELAQGWGPLCRFLGVPVPDTPMPKTNTTEEFQSRVASGEIGPPRGPAPQPA
ncbi:MAG: sulfotransferase family protein [Phenylobacterium sp.]